MILLLPDSTSPIVFHFPSSSIKHAPYQVHSFELIPFRLILLKSVSFELIPSKPIPDRLIYRKIPDLLYPLVRDDMFNPAMFFT